MIGGVKNNNSNLKKLTTKQKTSEGFVDWLTDWLSGSDNPVKKEESFEQLDERLEDKIEELKKKGSNLNSQDLLQLKDVFLKFLKSAIDLRGKKTLEADKVEKKLKSVFDAIENDNDNPIKYLAKLEELRGEILDILL